MHNGMPLMSGPQIFRGADFLCAELYFGGYPCAAWQADRSWSCHEEDGIRDLPGVPLNSPDPF